MSTASIDFSYRSLSGDARFIRYELWATTGQTPVSFLFFLNPFISSSARGRAFHWLELLVNIWIHSHPTDFPLRKAFPTPPAIDMWAPSGIYWVSLGTIPWISTFLVNQHQKNHDHQSQTRI